MHECLNRTAECRQRGGRLASERHGIGASEPHEGADGRIVGRCVEFPPCGLLLAASFGEEPERRVASLGEGRDPLRWHEHGDVAGRRMRWERDLEAQRDRRQQVDAR